MKIIKQILLVLISTFSFSVFAYPQITNNAAAVAIKQNVVNVQTGAQQLQMQKKDAYKMHIKHHLKQKSVQGNAQ